LFERLGAGKPLGPIGALQVGTPPSPATIKVIILDAGGGQKAKDVQRALLRAGFVVLGVNEAPANLRRSEVLFRPGRESRAEVVRGFFPGLERREADRGLLGQAAVAVVVGDDYQGRA
jgi:hypothetical protein